MHGRRRQAGAAVCGSDPGLKRPAAAFAGAPVACPDIAKWHFRQSDPADHRRDAGEARHRLRYDARLQLGQVIERQLANEEFGLTNGRSFGIRASGFGLSTDYHNSAISTMQFIEELENRASGGVVFTTIQKFPPPAERGSVIRSGDQTSNAAEHSDANDPAEYCGSQSRAPSGKVPELSSRRNIAVMTDEAAPQPAWLRREGE